MIANKFFSHSTVFDDWRNSRSLFVSVDSAEKNNNDDGNKNDYLYRLIYCNTIIKFEFMTTFFHKSSSHGYVGVRKYFVKHPKSYTYVTRHMYKLKEYGSGINAMGWLFETFKTRSLFWGIFLRKKRHGRRVYAAVVCDGTQRICMVAREEFIIEMFSYLIRQKLLKTKRKQPYIYIQISY